MSELYIANGNGDPNQFAQLIIYDGPTSSISTDTINIIK